MKEDLIKNYIMNIDFTNDNWSISKIKEDMRSFLGEEPGIDIEWSKDAFLNEKSGKPEIIEKIKSLSIVFTETNDKFKKLNFILESPK